LWRIRSFGGYILIRINTLSNVRELTTFLAGKAFEHGNAFFIDGYLAALWLPLDVHSDEKALVVHMSDTNLKLMQEATFVALKELGNYHTRESHYNPPIQNQRVMGPK